MFQIKCFMDDKQMRTILEWKNTLTDLVLLLFDLCYFPLYGSADISVIIFLSPAIGMSNTFIKVKLRYLLGLHYE